MQPDWQPTDDPLVQIAVERGGELLRLRRTTDDGWRIETVYSVRRDELMLTELHVTPAKAGPRTRRPMASMLVASATRWSESPLTARFLRSVHLDDERNLAQSLALKHGVPFRSAHRPADELDHLVGLAIPVFRQMRKAEAAHPGRRGRPDEYLAIIAAVYVNFLTKKSTAPVHDTAEALDLSQEYVRDALHRARVRDLLTRGPRGRAGGTLTQKGVDALQVLLANKQPSK